MQMQQEKGEDANSAELYRQKWDHMFQERAHFEWHCDFDKVSSLLDPYFKAALTRTASQEPGELCKRPVRLYSMPALT